MAGCQGGSCGTFQLSGGGALGIYQGSASGMKMSKGLMGRHLLGLAVAGVAVAASGTAFAELGQPAPWESTLQGSATAGLDHKPMCPNSQFGTNRGISVVV